MGNGKKGSRIKIRIPRKSWCFCSWIMHDIGGEYPTMHCKFCCGKWLFGHPRTATESLHVISIVDPSLATESCQISVITNIVGGYSRPDSVAVNNWNDVLDRASQENWFTATDFCAIVNFLSRKINIRTSQSRDRKPLCDFNSSFWELVIKEN